MKTISTHPAGTEPRPVLVFSPHPDDDVISMGGTLIRLVDQEHQVHVAYMTSGNIAVFDHDAWRFTDFVVEFNRLFAIDKQHTETVKERVQTFLRTKKPAEADSEDLLKIKALIRQTEARAAALACGIPPDQLEFMDLRFYRTGTIAKAPIHPQDIADIIALLQRLKPAQIYMASNLSRRKRSPEIGSALRGLALPRRLAGVGAARGGPCRSHQSGRSGAEKAGHLPASITERSRYVSRRSGPARVLAKGRGQKSSHGKGLRRAGLAGILRPGGLRSVE